MNQEESFKNIQIIDTDEVSKISIDTSPNKDCKEVKEEENFRLSQGMNIHFL